MELLTGACTAQAIYVAVKLGIPEELAKPAGPRRGGPPGGRGLRCGLPADAGAGFRLNRVVHTATPVSIIEAVTA